MYPLQPVTPNMIIPNVKERCPFTLPVQVRPHMTQHINRVTGWLIDNLQQNANLTPQRLALFHACYANGSWSSQVFLNIIAETCDVIDFLLATKYRDPNLFTNALDEAVQTMANIHVAKISVATPALYSQLTPENKTVTDQWLQYERNLANQLVAFLQQTQQPQQYGYPGVQQQPIGYPPQGNAFVQTGNYMGQQQQPQYNAPRMFPNAGNNTVTFAPSPTPVVDTGSNAPRLFRTETVLSAGNYQTPTPTPAVVAPAPAKPATLFERLSAGETLPASYELFSEYNEKPPRSIIFDLEKQRCVVTKLPSLSKVVFRVVNTEDSNVQYEKHKNFHLLPKRGNSGPAANTKPQPFAMDKAFSDLMKLQACETALAEFEAQRETKLVEENETLAILNHAAITRVIETKNTDYREVAAAYFEEKGMPVDADNSLIALHVVDVPTYGASHNSVELYKGPYNASFNVNEPHRHIATALKHLVGILPDGQWEKLNDNLTRFVNGRLRFVLGLEDATIDSYVDDIEDMVQLISDNAPNLLGLLNTDVVSQMRNACLDVDGNSLAFADDMNVGDEISNVFFSTVETVFLLPLFSRDFSLGTYGCEEGMVLKDSTPSLFNTVLECFSQSHNRARYIKWVLRDNECIYIYPSDDMDKCYWMSRVKY